MKRINQRNILAISSFILGVLIMSACQVNQKTKAVVQNDAHLQVAKDKLGENIKFTESGDKRFMLYQSIPSASIENQSFKFLVYDTQKEKIVMEKSVSNGYVRWLTNTEVEVFNTPGTMRNDQSRDDFTVVYNVITGKSTAKNDWKK